MELTFRWALKTNDPNEVTSVTIQADIIPRKGELINLDIKIEEDERVGKILRVDDVHYSFVSGKEEQVVCICH